jgi:hypothetical protein
MYLSESFNKKSLLILNNTFENQEGLVYCFVFSLITYDSSPSLLARRLYQDKVNTLIPIPHASI